MAKGKYKQWLTPQALALLRGWKSDGLKDTEIAANIGIGKTTLYEWINKYAEFAEALKIGKETADYIVQNELFESCKTRKIKHRKAIKLKRVYYQDKKRIEEEYIDYAEEETVIPANTTAQIFWLKNRKSSEWRDRREEVITTKVNQEDVDAIEGFINGVGCEEEKTTNEA